MFMALYLSLYVAFVLGIYTLHRAYNHFMAAAEQSSIPADDKIGCRVQDLSDVTYVLFTLSFGDNLKDVLKEGRQDGTNACGGLQVLKQANVDIFFLQSLFLIFTACLLLLLLLIWCLVEISIPSFCFDFLFLQPDTLHNILLLVWIILTNLLQVQLMFVI